MMTDPVRTTCYLSNVHKLALCCGLTTEHSADDVLKAAAERVTQTGTSLNLTLDEWLDLGNNYRTNNTEHA
jgi:hypothetical protein